MEIVSQKTKSEEGQKVLEGPSPERREKLAERLVDIKVLSEIKEKRALLTREMAKARRQNDKATMDRITAERERLTEKKKALCLRMTGAKKAEIKEKRRLLTKQMTIARRQKDMQAMEQITAERQKLNAVTKALTGYIKKVDYRCNRKE
jgi:uncharacterized membrane protein (DUF106 family)